MKKINKHILIIAEIYPSGLTGTTVKTRNTYLKMADLGFKIDICCISFGTLINKKLTHPNIRIFSVTKDGRRRFRFSTFKRVFSFFVLVPLLAQRIYDSRMKELVQILLDSFEYDLVIYDSFSTLQYLQNQVKKSIYIDEEDMTDLFLKRAQYEKNVFLKLFHYNEYWRAKIFESHKLSNVNQVWAISDLTAERLSGLTSAAVKIMPTTVMKKRSVFSPKSKHLVFSGTLNWLENVKGLKWFIDTQWDQVLLEYPKTKLFVTGQLASPELVTYLQSKKNVIYKGFVKDLGVVYQEVALAISPIFINSGIKVKILGYLNYGIPVVSTPQALWGMASSAGVFAADEADFGSTINDILGDLKKRTKASRAALKNIELHHSDKVLEFFLKKNL